MTFLAQASTDSGYNPALVLLILAVTVGAIVVCFLKGKPGMGIAGLFIGLVAWIGAIRLAKPDSWWARQYYKPNQMDRSIERYGRPSVPEPRVGPPPLSSQHEDVIRH